VIGCPADGTVRRRANIEGAAGHDPRPPKGAHLDALRI